MLSFKLSLEFRVGIGFTFCLSPLLILAESIPKYDTLPLTDFVLLLPSYLVHGSQRSHPHYSDDHSCEMHLLITPFLPIEL